MGEEAPRTSPNTESLLFRSLIVNDPGPLRGVSDPDAHMYPELSLPPILQNGPRLLMVAAYSGSKACVSHLIKMGADWSLSDDAGVPLGHFASCGSVGVCKMLYNLGVPFTEECVHMAAETDRYRIVRWFIELGLIGVLHPVLITAARFGAGLVVGVLLTETKVEDDGTALMIACQRKHTHTYSCSRNGGLRHRACVTRSKCACATGTKRPCGCWWGRSTSRLGS